MSALRNFVIGLFVSLLLIGPGSAAVKPPSFDCFKARLTVEHMICNDPDLSKSDNEIPDQFKKLFTIPGADAATLRQSENDWIKNIRDKCASHRCISKAYFDRGNELFTVALQINAARLNLPLPLLSPPSTIIATIANSEPTHLISFQLRLNDDCIYLSDEAPFNKVLHRVVTTVTRYDISNVSKPKKGCTSTANEPNQYMISDAHTRSISAVRLSGSGSVPMLDDGQGAFFYPDPFLNEAAIGMIGVNQRSLVWLPGAAIEGLADTSQPGTFVATIYLASGQQKLVILSGPKEKFDPGRMDKLDQRLRQTIPPPVVEADAFSTRNTYDVAEAALETAGVRQLFRNSGGLRRARRLEILDDYLAYLTYHNQGPLPLAGQALNGRDVVDTVSLDGQLAAIQPQSPAAWKHYADAAFTGISNVPTFALKQNLTRQTIAAYLHLKANGIALTPAEMSFLTINIMTAPQNNVCEYVAYMFNNNLASQILGVPHPADLLGDGHLVYTEIDAEGTAHQPTLNIQNPDGSWVNPPDTGNSEISIFPFHSAYYVVETEDYGRAHSQLRSALYAVQSFDGKQPCSFSRKDITEVVIDKVHGLEQSVEKSAPSPGGINEINFIQPNPDPSLYDGVDANGGETTKYAPTDLGGKTLPNRLWLVTTASDDIPCEFGMLGWYNESSGQLINDPLNNELQSEQRNIQSCGGSTGTLLQFQGTTYIQLSVQEPVNDGDTLFEILSVSNHNMAPVFRVIQKATVYSPRG